MEWLVLSLVLSVVLTVVLNVALRAFPNAGDRAARALEERAWQQGDTARGGDKRVRVYFPWKAMIVGSILLTILVNLVLWFA